MGADRVFNATIPDEPDVRVTRRSRSLARESVSTVSMRVCFCTAGTQDKDKDKTERPTD